MVRAVAAVAALAAAAMVDAGAAVGSLPSLYDYDYDGATTYCYIINQGLAVTKFDWTYVTLDAKDADCPLLLTISQTTQGVIYPDSDVEYKFTASLNFDDNRFGMTQLEATVIDPVTKRPAQIGHANVHACSRTSVCDVFRDGTNRRISDQETSNFTDEKALFVQKVNFAAAGEYNVFAHVILPPRDPRNSTYQFVAFTTTTITAREDVAAKISGTSTGTMIGIIVGAVVALLAIVVGVIFYRRKRPAGLLAPDNDHFRHSHGPYAPSNTAKSKASRLDWNGDPEFQFGHDRYQASMVSEYSKQPPALNASALMFQNNGSSSRGKQKTVSSGGSSHRSAGSPRLRDDGSHRRTQGIALPLDHGVDTYETYYHDKLDRYGGDNSTMKSYSTETSMGTSHAYPSDAHLYPPPHRGPPVASHRGGSVSSGAYTYDRESDLSSIHDDYDDYPRGGPGGIRDDDGLHTVSELDRDSVASMGTVDFALPPPLRPTGDSFRAEDVPNLASTNLAFNDEEISKQTVEYIDSLRQQNYRDTEQASDYVSDFGSTNRTFDFRDSAQSENVYGASFRSSTDDQFTDTQFRHMKRAQSNDSESYEF